MSPDFEVDLTISIDADDPDAALAKVAGMLRQGGFEVVVERDAGLAVRKMRLRVVEGGRDAD